MISLFDIGNIYITYFFPFIFHRNGSFVEFIV